jgi:hypothetical protein
MQMPDFPAELQLPEACDDCTETWNWIVVYLDGSQVTECQGPGKPHLRWDATIDVARVALVVLAPNTDGRPYHQLRLGPNSRAIFFRRRPVAMGDIPDEVAAAHRSHCLGIERIVSIAEASDGPGALITAIQHYVFYFDDGRTIVSNAINPY